MSSRTMTLIEKFRHINLWLLVVVVLLSFIGIAMQYSAAKGNMEPWAMAQMVRFSVGLVLMFVVAIIDIRFWFRHAYIFYAIGVILLLAVAVTGYIGKGAQRWIQLGGVNVQPSEAMKIALLLVLAKYFHSVHPSNLQNLRTLAIPLALITIPVGLILKQPNLGTASIIGMMGVMTLFMAGISWKRFIFAGVVAAMCAPIAWANMFNHQKRRIYTFLNPESDPLGAGYNILQSKIAIGAGGLTGKGFVKGSQSQLSFLPEHQTDFIFTMIAEEFGLLGGLALLMIYAALFIIAMRIALSSEHQFGRLVASGVTAIFFFHFAINVGMVMGLLPVVGVPLLLVSYGGSSLLAAMISLGFLMNIHIHRKTDLYY